MARKSNKIRHAEFAKRLIEACDRKRGRSPSMGRQVYIKNELKKVGVRVSSESVSKWFAGEVAPRKNTLGPLAKLLEVTPAFLTYGTSDSSQGGGENLQVNKVSMTPHAIKVDAVLTIPSEVDNLVRKLIGLKKIQWPSG